MSAPNRKTILLVEDELIIAMIETKELERYGYAVIAATSGEKAIAMAESWPEIDLILMDINLGNGIDGTVAAERILAQREIPIVFLSSHTEPEVVAKTELITYYGYVVKNSGITVLDASIKMAFKLFDANRAIRREKEHLDTTLNSIGDAVIATDTRGIITRMNPVAEHLTGCCLDGSLGKPIDEVFTIINAHSREPVGNPVHHVLETGVQVGLANHTVLVSLDGREYQIADSGAPIKGSDGRIGGVVLVFRDVSDEYRSREALQDSEQNFHGLFSHMIEGAALHQLVRDSDGKAVDYTILDVNPAFERTLGITREMVVGKTSRQAYGVEEAPYLAIYAEVAQTGRPAAFQTWFPAMSKHFSISVYCPRPGYFATIFEDITERKQAEQELQERKDALQRQNSLFSTLIENLQIGVFMVEAPSGQPLLANEKAQELLGRGILPDVSRKTLNEVYRAVKADTHEPYPPDEMPIVAAMDGRYSQIDDLLVERPDGSTALLEIKGSPVMDENGKVWASLVSFQDISGRKQVEAKLNQTNEYLNSLFDFASAPIITWDPESRITRFNHAFERLTGRLQEEVLGQSLELLFPPDTRAGSMALIQMTLGGERWESVEIPILTREGKARTISWNSAAIQDADGRIISTIAQGVDISEHLQSELALRSSEERLSLALNAAKAGTWEWDLRTNQNTWSDELWLLYGLIPRSCEPNFDNWMATIHPDDRDAIGRSVSLVAENGLELHINWRVNAASGSERWLMSRGQPELDGNGKAIRYRGVVIDISERKRIEAELNESNKYLNNLFDHANAPIVIWDPESRISRFNHAFERLTGWLQEDVLLHPLEILFPPAKREASLALIRKTLAGERWENEEIPILTKAGQIRTIIWNSGTVRDSEGRIISTIAHGTDITERKQAEQALHQSGELFKRMVWDMNVGVLLQGPKAEILLCNPRSLELLGLTEDQILGKSSFDPYWNVIHEDGTPFPGDTHPVPQAIAKRAPVRRVVMGVFRPVTHDRVWLLVDADPQLDENGEVHQVVCSFVDISEVKQAEKEIQRSEARLKTLVSILQHPADSTQAFLDFALQQALNLTASRIGYIYHYHEDKKQFVLNTWSKDVMPACRITDPQTIYDLEKTGIWGEAVRQRKPIIVNDFTAPHPQKKGYPEGHVELYRFMTLPVFTDGEIMGVVGLANKDSDYDETDLLQVSLLMDAVWKVIREKQTQERIANLLKEKELILKEVHHRIKNNMGVVFGLLSLQAESTRTAAAANALRDAGTRVQSMMILYDQLYRADHYGVASSSDYLTKLTDQAVMNFPQGTKVAVSLKLATFDLDTKQMQPLGIIVNELLTNIMKYAFKGRDSGTIEIVTALTGHTVRLEVRDDGQGMPETVDFEHSTGFGLTLIGMLTKQLGGTIRIERGEGTRVILEFPA